jgi:hypothetical protein
VMRPGQSLPTVNGKEPVTDLHAEPTVPPTVPRIRRGGKAAQEAYSCLDIRQNIFACLDRSTLARMMRLSRASTASVAAVLYNRVWVAVMAKMGRGSVRLFHNLWISV